MSSGEKAKPPFEERNPFDISRRSGPEVAAEIAKRMAAWKQARARTSAKPGTIPGGEVKFSGGDAKSPPIAAPVQPARMPAPPAGRGAASSTPRVPYFASASATRRAMPPAPSLKQGSAHPPAPAGDERAGRADEPAVHITAPALEQESPRHDEPTAKPEGPLPDATPAASPAMAAATLEPDVAPAAPAADSSDPVESPLVAKTPEPEAVETDDDERRRAEARAIKARWVAARDLDELIETSGRAPTAEAAATAAGNVDIPLPGETPDEADRRDELLLDDPAEPEYDSVPEATADIEERAAAAEIAAPTVRLGPTLDAPSVGATPAPVADRDVATEAPALDIAALDEMAGRREPTFDAPVARAAPAATDAARKPGIAAQDQVADESRTQPASTAEPAPVADDALSIAALDEAAGRREPTFDEPSLPAAKHRRTVEIPAEATAPLHADAPDTAPGTASADTRNDPSQLSTAALDEAASRKEPTFDEPVTAKPAPQTPPPHIKLRPIETRIEARRIDTLRADPQLAVRRPIFPHIELEEWDVPLPVAAQANRERRSTGWAIGLGTVLLIAGITAPAAIWQQGRQVQDQVAVVSPPPAPQQAPAPGATTTAQDQAQTTLPESPPPEAPAPAPPVTAQEPSAPSAPDTAAPKPEEKPEAEQVAADRQPATTLGAINDGGEVNEAPVVAPPPPMVNLASKTSPARTAAPMVARPFVPQGGDGPFLRAPTTGETSVPVAGAPAQSAAVGVKPSLMVQLKPPATVSKPVASKPRSVTRKPKPFFQQSPEQMFQTLIDTLGEGKPVNPATKPVPPSNRK